MNLLLKGGMFLLHLTWFEFFVRTIPESFFVVLAVHAFSKTAISTKRYILASLLYAGIVFAVRAMPISFGIHTIINVIVLVLIANNMNKISMTVSIRSGILTAIVLFISELFCIFVIQLLLHVNTDAMMGNVYLKTLYSLPSLILLMIISLLSYYLLVIRKREKHV